MALDYTIDTSPFQFRAYPAESFSLRVIYCYLARGTLCWNWKNHTAPFWRLYWNRTPGASIWLDGTETPLPPDKLVLVAPQTPFDKSTRCAVEHFHIHFYAGPLFDNGINRHIFPIKLVPDIRRAMDEMIDLLGKNAIDSRLMAKGAFVVSWALNAIENRLSPRQVSDSRIARVQEYIATNLATTIEGRHLAALAGMNNSSFIRFFKAACGATPQHYVTSKRIDRACDLLHSPSLNLDQIAEQCGFCDRNYFTTVFTKAMKESPVAYRKRMVG